MQSLRAEADNAVARAEEAEAKNKKYEQVLLEKEQEITSLQHKISVLDADLEKAEGKLADLKAAQEDGEQSKTANEGLQRKIQLLEEELDAADKNLKEAMDKYVYKYCLIGPPLTRRSASLRLRQVDVKAEHFERQVTRLEQERDQWEKKYEVRSRLHRVHPVPALAATSPLIIIIAFWYDQRATNAPFLPQEAQEKYRESKRELDELVATMEGL